MPLWLPPALFALASFGFWGVCTKLAISHIDYKSAIVFQTIGVIIVGLITLTLINYKPMINLKGFSFSVLTGMASATGCLFFFIAAERGKISTVVALTGLYPLVTIILSLLFLHEVVTLKQFSGIGLALIAIYLMV